ncbi:RNA-directed DNA polymerase, eukaryota, reverse transcriptase zinc-binding domain protein [Tanacetum coccineum]
MKVRTKKSSKKQVEGVRLSKPALNLQYRRVEKDETSKQKVSSNENKKNVGNGSSKPLVEPIKVTTSNSFSALEEDDSRTWDEDNGGTNDNAFHVVNDSDSEDVDEYITMKEGTKLVSQESSNDQEASTPLERTRIIVGWNHDDVDVSVIHQDPQVIHTRIWIKADKKEFFCSFVYAHNYYIHRRPLWSSLCLHKRYINNRSWCLLGDFNASLYVDDTSIGPSTLDITMRKFKECVETMEVMDVQRTGLHFTWNQKPKGKDGILRKLDRVLANLEFQDQFVGVHAIFKPYRISDHSPSVLSIPSRVKLKPKPFKFFNVAILDKRFKGLVRDGWSSHVSGFDMFRVVKKLKGLKKPIRTRGGGCKANRGLGGDRGGRGEGAEEERVRERAGECVEGVGGGARGGGGGFREEGSRGVMGQGNAQRRNRDRILGWCFLLAS